MSTNGALTDTIPAQQSSQNRCSGLGPRLAHPFCKEGLSTIQWEWGDGGWAGANLAAASAENDCKLAAVWDEVPPGAKGELLKQKGQMLIDTARFAPLHDAPTMAEYGAAKRLLPRWRSAPLALRLRETVSWWVDAQRAARSARKQRRILRDLLDSQHKNQSDVVVTVPLELLRQEEDSKRMFNIVLAVIASISLLVGGIGIMNVMLATVTERTREIGIRRALGAKKRHIIQQFLVEAGVLSALGGVVGVAIGIVLPKLITYWFDQTTHILPQHVLMAFGISAGVGIAFGIYPAWRAANMDPVDALRHE